ncbi:MAG: hypothetical protein QF590_00220 [Dehalococcoidia bacterium]|jgi:hypothetical protein|nr:hypothetical protein [Dehalococcoidia bacterium]MDP7089709.1 hypothetical protein [Dehalococcoidia bacterium]MDP7261909.1 hypothetical protein [Dehalococcoidia bacterium]MDP7485266.1 hypothetical protein [Dehalococcoidia bacterium]
MHFLVVLPLALIVASLIYYMGRRSGYEQGRLAECKEWSTKIRELDE